MTQVYYSQIVEKKIQNMHTQTHTYKEVVIKQIQQNIQVW